MEGIDSRLLPNPVEKASIISKLFYWWLNSFFRKGYKKDLAVEDLYSVPKEDKTEKLSSALEREWNKEVRKVKLGKQPSLRKAITRCFGLKYCSFGLYVLFEECGIRVTQTILLSLLIRSYSENTPEGYHRSLCFAAGLIVCPILFTLIHHPYFFGVQHTGMKIRVACCGLVYRKALTLSTKSLAESATVGHVVNLLTNDVSRFDQSVVFLHFLWVGPIQACIVICILWFYMGPAVFAGFATLFMYVLLQSGMGKMFSKFRSVIALLTDERISIMDEILSAMKVIKMYSWEMPFKDLAEAARKREVDVIRKVSLLRAINMALFFTSSKVILLLTFMTAVLTGYPLTAEVVFLAVALYNCVRLVMTLFFPFAVAQVAETLISIERIQKFLLLEEHDVKSSVTKSNLRPNISDCGITVDSICASWNTGSNSETISNVSFTADPGKLIAIVGPVGGGKTSLLMSILGELPVTSGSVNIRGRIAYVCQEPWVFGASIRQNIILRSPFNKSEYQSVIQASCLEKDLEHFTFGDLTLVGERGAMLSGGQKARVNLARALYVNADIYLLDDPLSAVDAHVGRHLFQECIQGYLKKKVCILVTHQVQFLQKADHIIILKDGKCTAQGSYQQLLDNGVDFTAMTTPKENATSQLLSNYRIPRIDSMDLPFGSTLSVNEGLEMLEMPPEHEDAPQQKAVEETKSTGGVSGEVYKKFFAAAAGPFVHTTFIVSSIITQVLMNGSDYWLSVWTNAVERSSQWVDSASDIPCSGNNFTNYSNIEAISNCSDNELAYATRSPDISSDPFNNMYIYAGIVFACFLFSILRTALFFTMCMNASIKLHNLMFASIIRATTTFFDNNPVGRILNRFARDIGIIDENLPACAYDMMEIFQQLIGILAIVIMVNYWLAIPTVILATFFVILRKVYIETARDVKRLEGTTRSPIFSHLSASVQGITTIRAFGAQETFIQEFDNHQDTHSAAWYTFLATTRWLAIRLDWMCVVFITTTVFAILAATSEAMSGDVGLAITSAFVLSGMFQWGVRQSTEVENQMTSVERIIEYSKLEPEAELESTTEKAPPKGWPEEGKIEVDGMFLYYSLNDAPVLKNISFTIMAKEKIGIVGRTGAGKSSIVSALFRLVEPQGTILIDGVKTTEIGLHDLRKKLSIIPQDPVLFIGTVRKNLDPFSDHTDEDLWSALEEVQLKDTVNEMSGGLNASVVEKGANFSVGQRQLVCLARAILRQNKILILDEATANVDPRTDFLIQETIRAKFSQCTVLTIAHRLNTIMDSNRIMVLDAGKVVEFDEPFALMRDENGYLYKMVQQTGSHTASTLMKIAEENHLLKCITDKNNEVNSKTKKAQMTVTRL